MIYNLIRSSPRAGLAVCGHTRAGRVRAAGSTTGVSPRPIMLRTWRATSSEASDTTPPGLAPLPWDDTPDQQAVRARTLELTMRSAAATASTLSHVAVLPWCAQALQTLRERMKTGVGATVPDDEMLRWYLRDRCVPVMHAPLTQLASAPTEEHRLQLQSTACRRPGTVPSLARASVASPCSLLRPLFALGHPPKQLMKQGMTEMTPPTFD
jgi:hypothetical protein